MFFIFFTGYLTTSTEDYDIKWTMPQCVLALRLIGLSFNVWDGSKPDVSTEIFNRVSNGQESHEKVRECHRIC